MSLKLLPLTKLLPLVAAVTLISGCSLIPEYQVPEASDTTGWNGLEQTQDETILPDWKSFMADAQLQQLIEMALTNNKDLRQTVLSVAALKAQYQISSASELPSIGLSASSTNTRTSDAYTDAGTVYTHANIATVGLSSYEIDLFGKAASASDEVLETYLAQDSQRRAAVISLISEVAQSYMRLLAYQQYRTLTEDTVKAYEETLALVQTRFDAGYSDALTLAQSKTQLYGAQGTLSQYQLAEAQEYNTLRQLVGAPIDEYITGTLPSGDGAVLSELKVGASSDLILNRPDVQAAEHTLKAANANIGVARAALFPSISLTSGIGLASDSLTDLVGSDSGYWTFSPSLSLPIFSWGSNQAAIEKAKIEKEALVIAYQQTIETAFKEVSDSLLGQHYYMQQWQAQQQNLSANETYYQLAKIRYEKGNDSYIDFLDAQRSLFSAKESELAAHLNLLTSRIELFKALGGGWAAADDETVFSG